MSRAHATAEYDQKKGGRRIIDGGLAPNKKYAVSAGLSRAGGPYCFLTSEPAHRTLVQLEGIGPSTFVPRE